MRAREDVSGFHLQRKPIYPAILAARGVHIFSSFSDFSLDRMAARCYNIGIMKNTHKCGACEDSGFIDEQETVYCDCAEGDLMAEIDAEFRAEEKAEARATDYAYAVDSQGDDLTYEGW